MLIERSVSDTLPLKDNPYVEGYDPTLNTQWVIPATTTISVSQCYVEVMKRKSGIKVSQSYIEVLNCKSGMEIAHDYIEVLVRRNGWQIYES